VAVLNLLTVFNRIPEVDRTLVENRVRTPRRGAIVGAGAPRLFASVAPWVLGQSENRRFGFAFTGLRGRSSWRQTRGLGYLWSFAQKHIQRALIVSRFF